ncbi:CTP synthase [Roseisolibacter sp. H3M3-2]|uniref:CTP synthase C-terminal region-related (seleno)protein n=1 Tax=Roseisolibacter sp. H3M3-2 TaxID=3031323 RepID=UPI0023DBD713|nr:CTP synthase [Roseisolibacter sp. H3M3-2]MDF1504784.1 CTP synthase [Roseisolibacter sp. H3M3-2]
MPEPLRVALVGDHDPSVVAHRAIPRALALAARDAGVAVEATWLATDAIADDAVLAPFDAVWCVPASPYRSADGALRAIRVARESGRPFLGTCGGFQHALLEYARAVLGWADAAHAETDPDAAHAVVAPLACALVEERGVVRFRAGSRLAEAYGAPEAVEGYHCRYGLNPAVRDALTGGALRVAAEDESGDVRAVELEGHPFFVATLFQPERAALHEVTPPPVAACVRAAAAARAAGLAA